MPTTDRYVALLRGVNVGRAKRVGMADLRALAERLGFTDVSTLLNSGNVVFTAPAGSARRAAALIEAALAADLGVPARVAVLDALALDRVMRENPFVDRATEHQRLFAAVLMDGANRAPLAALAREDWGDEAFALGTGAAYLWCPPGASESPLTLRFGRAAGDSATTRNWATMLKLQARVAGAV